MRTVTSRPMKAATLAISLIVLCVSCSSDAGTDPAPAAAGTLAPPDGASYPPWDYPELKDAFDPVLQPLGMRLSRGALADSATGSYGSSDHGNHLALYAEFRDPVEPDAYIEALVVLVRYLTPELFARWSGLESYDLCIETPAENASGTSGRESGTAAIQFSITRAAAAGVDWSKVEVDDLVGLTKNDSDVTFVVNAPADQAARYLESDAATDSTGG